MSTSRYRVVTTSSGGARARRPACWSGAGRVASLLTAGLLLAALSGCGDPDGGGGGGGGYVVGSNVADR
ncbi:MAG: hypothetical protein AVDCRST_MAG29-2499 [uncultured Nocardioidaceae bacterium]|uniref:Uncharacterized protein n=1 Tax=uncultured Nocardioidaceae bacterium TaxID=253824 RepID=A0A6J4MC95_9ACTN|nr:MAG: hypothetical protein AVDCRST_MAG29-2499 [uncultured Nocardioidaceae bacterium]